jgi:oligopeptide/dipeptide ABC transporter ATP-binding protein
MEVENLTKWFPLSRGFLREMLGRGERLHLKAVDGVSFSIRQGEVLGLAGESGCGKSTTGMTLLKLYEPSSGIIRFMGEDLASIRDTRRLKAFRRNAQIVFQNPFESLNPRLTVFQSVREPIAVHFDGDEEFYLIQVVAALERAGLRPPASYLARYPHELSGGQLQRVAIARAIGVEPRFVVADEPVSMLDVSIRAGILTLLRFFTRELQMGMLYISHDLSTMKQVCTRVGVMYLGKIVEIGATASILHDPRHPYAQALVAAIPKMGGDGNRKRIHLQGAVPNPINMPSGCRFHPRCPAVMSRCRLEEPVLRSQPDGRQVACHLYA